MVNEGKVGLSVSSFVRSLVRRLGLSVSLLAVVLLVPFVAGAATVSYVDNQEIPEWARADVELTTQFRIFQGDSAGTFRPNDNISRAEFTAIIMRAFSIKPDTSLQMPFSDVAGGWYESVVLQAVQTGVIRAEDFGGQFRPNQAITRAEMARMVARAVDARRVIFTPNEALDFSDVSSGNPFYEAIRKASSYGIINGMGDGTFEPDGKATRAQAAAMIARAMRLGKPQEVDVPPTEAGYLNKNLRLAFHSLFTSFELAAVRPTGTGVDLSPVSRWFTPAAREKWEAILTRDVPGKVHTGLFYPREGPAIYIGEDHAFIPATEPSINNNEEFLVPLQRQFDGGWAIVDIPFAALDIQKLGSVDGTLMTYLVTDSLGAYAGLNNPTKDPEGHLRQLTQLEARGTTRYRFMRVGGGPWEESQWADLIREVHATFDAKQETFKHQVVWVDSRGAHINLYNDDVEFVSQVVALQMWAPQIVSVDGVPFARMAEAPFFKSAIAAAVAQNEAMFADVIIKANPDQYVPEFLNILSVVRERGDSLR